MKTAAMLAAVMLLNQPQAWAGFSYKVAEDFKSKNYSLKLGVQVAAEKGRYEMSFGDMGGAAGNVEEQSAQAAAGAAGVGSQMGQDAMMGGMDKYLDMVKDPEQKAKLAQRMAAQKAMIKGAYASPMAQAAEQANTQHMQQGAGHVAKEVGKTRRVSILDVKSRSELAFNSGNPQAPKKLSKGKLGRAESTGWGWKTDSATASAGKPKAANLDGRKAMLHTIKLAGTLSNPKSRESDDFNGELKFWMDPSKEAALGEQWRAYDSARRKAGSGGMSLRENFDAAMYAILTPEARQQLDGLLDGMEGVPLKVHYRIEGRALKYRIAGVMKSEGAGDMGLDLADATEEAAAGEEGAAEGPASATKEDPWELEAALSNIAAAEPPASAFTAPDGYR